MINSTREFNACIKALKEKIASARDLNRVGELFGNLHGFCHTGGIGNRGISLVAQEDVWLLDFWAKKSLSGILTMPLTRHLLVHLNAVSKLI